jgi:hypothetical protein
MVGWSGRQPPLVLLLTKPPKTDRSVDARSPSSSSCRWLSTAEFSQSITFYLIFFFLDTLLVW